MSKTRPALEVSTLPHLTHPKYRPDIDGLRALGVLLVVIFHAFPRTLPGGFVGVDIFFVVSGYLISSIIFGNLEAGTFSFSEFYSRRIRRIFPALAIVLATAWGLGWLLLVLDEQKQLGMHIAAGSGFVSNLLLWSESGYFDNDASTKPLLHLWSLGIEEQFYIFWPLLLGLLWKRNYSNYNFLGITLLIAIASFAVNILTVHADPVAAFYSPWSRFWELMVGGILAYLVLHRPQVLTTNPDWQSAAGLTLIVVSVALLNKNAAFPGWWALLPTMGTFLIIAAGPNAWLNRHFLSSRGMVGIGLISYPLYLWHWLLLSMAWIVRGKTPPTSTRALMVAASFLLAYLTYSLLEKRMRRGGTRTVIALAATMAGLFVIGLVTQAEILRPRNDHESIGAILEALHDWEYPSGFQKTSFGGVTVRSKTGSAKPVLFIGDSHIEQYGPRIASLLDGDPEQYRSALFLTSAGCAPVPDSGQTNEYRVETCNSYRRHVTTLVHDAQISTVVIGAAWNLYFLKSSPRYSKNMDIDFELANLERFIRSLAVEKEVYLILDNPNGPPFEPRNFFAGTRFSGLTVKPHQESIPLADDQGQLGERLTEIARKAGAKVIDPVAHLCPERRCPAMTAAGKPVYKDDNHYRPFYVRQHADFIDIVLAK